MTLVPVVVEQDGRSERSFDLMSRLMRDRIIFLTGDIEDHMASIIIGQLLYLESVDANRDIYLYINSGGGVVSSGFGIRDTMRFIKPDVSTICVGQACSMGAILLASGAKGKRVALPNSRIMCHQPSGGTRGMASDIEIQYREIQKLKEMINQMVAEDTGQSLDAVERIMDRDTFMSASQAVDFGLVDKVITNRSEI